MPLAFFAVLLAGCAGSPPPEQLRFSLQAGQDSSQFIAPALDATARQFFRPTGGGSTPATTLVDIDKHTLSPDSTTPYRQVLSRQLALKMRVEHPVARNLSFNAAVMLAQGHSRFVLPQGAGVLRDPILIRFNTQTAGIEAGLVRRFDQNTRLKTDMEFGLGASVTRTRTHIGSALLDVANQSSSKTGFAYAGVGLTLIPAVLGNHPVRLGSRVMVFPEKTLSIQTGLGVDF